MERTGNRIERSRDNQVIAGVCGGIAEHFNMDPTMVRLIAAAMVVFGVGSIIPLYIIMWIVMPEAE